MPWLIRIFLCGCFLIAFLQYELSFSGAGFVPLAGIAVCALLVLSGRRRTDRLQRILEGGGLLFAGMVFGEVISYTSHDTYSIIYGLVFIGLFLCARLIVQEVGISNVIHAYSQAAILTVCIFLIAGRQTLFSGESARFSGGSRAHPNLVGFVLAGYLPVIVWRMMEERVKWKKRIFIGLSIATSVMLFVSGSRGSLAAVLAAGMAILLRGIGVGWLQRIRVRHLHIIALLILFPLAIAFLMHNNRIGHMADYVVDFLALNTKQRGLKSGFSGRTGFWQTAFRFLGIRDRWLFGFGYRAGDRMVGTIDNGYVQLLFESGLIAGGLIFSSMIRAFLLLWKASSVRVNNAWSRFYLMLWSLMIVYFLNNISARYLFSFGSPFSLCVFFMMVASRRELVGHKVDAQISQRPVLNPNRASGALVQNRSILRD